MKCLKIVWLSILDLTMYLSQTGAGFFFGFVLLDPVNKEKFLKKVNNDFINLILKNDTITLIILILLGLGSLILSGISKYKVNKENKEIKEQNTFLKQKVNDFEDIVDIKLKETLKSIVDDKFGRNKTLRANIYLKEKGNGVKGNGFRRLARFSYHKEFNNSKGRLVYPDGEGTIWKIWENNDFYKDSITDKNNNEKQYLDEQKKKFNIENDIAKSFKMPSCSYCGITIRDEKNEDIGILLFESTEANFFDSVSDNLITEEDLMKIYKSIVKGKLSFNSLFLEGI